MKFKVILLVLLLTFGISLNAFASYPPEAIDKLIEQVNSERIKYDLEPLIISQSLTQVAIDRANDMANRHYFAHTSPEGLKWYLWFYLNKYYFNYAGENLARRFRDYNDIVPAWMASPTHRANILNPYFTETGMALSEESVNGVYIIIVVQEFASPS